MTTALGYIRRSKKSDDRTVSLEAQRGHILEYCKRQGFDLRHVVEHDGVSGTKRARFAALEAAVAQIRPNLIVVYQLDRLARDVAGLLDYLRSLARRGIRVMETSGNEIKLTEPGDFLSTGVQGLFAEFFPILVSRKTRDALGALRSRGRRYSNLTPFGYRHVQDGVDCEGNPICALLEDPNEQTALRIIERCKINGLGARRALGVLRAEGYTGRASLAVIHKTLKRI